MKFDFDVLLYDVKYLVGFYPRKHNPPQASQANNPGSDSVRVITVSWQWEQKVCPGTSYRAVDIATRVTEIYKTH